MSEKLISTTKPRMLPADLSRDPSPVTSLASTYPIKFDLTEIPYPSTYSESRETIENSYTSEAGTDLLQVTRYGKRTWTMGFKCLESLAKTLESFSDKDSFTLTFYDTQTESLSTATVRMRGFTKTLIPKSETITYCNGLYNISFNLLEF